MDKAQHSQVEEVYNSSPSISDDITKLPQHNVVGTVQILSHNETVLIPTPSPDPKDPLNLPPWRKWAITILLGFYSATAVLLTSGMGAIFTAVVTSYPGQEARSTNLLTYPTFFMGIGNLISMPLALSIGRRPVFIFSLLLLVLTGVWCACSKNLGSHIAGRDIMAVAAGQSEALVPMMVQEIHFLHERGTKLGWVSAMQAAGTAAFFLAQNYLVADLGWRWWFLLVCETGYDRPDDANEGEAHIHLGKNPDIEDADEVSRIIRVTTARGNVLDLEHFSPRTWKDDLRLVTYKPQWSKIPLFYKQLAQGLCIPTMFWILLINGTFLGLYVLQVSTFASILMAPPYSFAFNSLGYVQACQIVDSILFLPILGCGIDWLIKAMSRRNKGIYEPEYRLILLIVPAIVGVVCAVMYGQAASHPTHYTWGTVAVTYNAIFFAFLGANIVGITYAIDSFPLVAGPLLVLICTGRGFISFGLSYATLPATKTLGYDGTMNIFAIIAGVLCLLGIPAYMFGRRIRQMSQKWFQAKE